MITRQKTLTENFDHEMFAAATALGTDVEMSDVEFAFPTQAEVVLATADAEFQQGQEVETMRCPECGSPMLRGFRPRTVTCEGYSEIVEMPSWYCACGEAWTILTP